MKTFKQFIESNLPTLLVKPSSDDVFEVMDSNFTYPKLVGNKTVNIKEIKGMLDLSDPRQKERVKNLAKRISSPTGYISRIIIDDQGHVIEGQHRLEALKLLGYEEIPVTIIQDLENKYNIKGTFEKLNKLKKLHPDQIRSLILNSIEAIEDSVTPEQTLEDYYMPDSIQPYFEIAVNSLIRKDQS